MTARQTAAQMQLPPGYSLTLNRRGHYAILRPDGSMLRQASGQPVHVSASPSDWRSRKNEIARMRRAIAAEGI